MPLRTASAHASLAARPIASRPVAYTLRASSSFAVVAGSAPQDAYLYRGAIHYWNGRAAKSGAQMHSCNMTSVVINKQTLQHVRGWPHYCCISGLCTWAEVLLGMLWGKSQHLLVEAGMVAHSWRRGRKSSSVSGNWACQVLALW